MRQLRHAFARVRARSPATGYSEAGYITPHAGHNIDYIFPHDPPHLAGHGTIRREGIVMACRN